MGKIHRLPLRCRFEYLLHLISNECKWNLNQTLIQQVEVSRCRFDFYTSVASTYLYKCAYIRKEQTPPKPISTRIIENYPYFRKIPNKIFISFSIVACFRISHRSFNESVHRFFLLLVFELCNSSFDRCLPLFNTKYL